MGMLAEALEQSGHEVVWWTSTYDHGNRRFRASRSCVVSVSARYEIRLLHTIFAGPRAVSAMRLLNNIAQALVFWWNKDLAAKPDIIVCAMPTPELSWVAARFSVRYGVPLVLDARDMWPDVFIDLIGPVRLILVSPYVTLMRWMLKYSALNSTACFSITEPFLNWILGYACRSRGKLDGVFPLGFRDSSEDCGAVEQRCTKGNDLFNVVFLGRLNRTVADDFDSVLTAIDILRPIGIKFRFSFAGDGDFAESMRNRAKAYPEIVFLGQLGSLALNRLKKEAHVALLCVARRKDYQMSLSNKVFDYLSAGLPIASRLSGVVGRLINEGRCGFVYDDGRGLARGLLELAKNENIRRETGVRARIIFDARFSAARIYPSMVVHLGLVSFAHRRGGTIL